MIAWQWSNRSKRVYHANVTNGEKIGQYTKNFPVVIDLERGTRSEEHTSELQSH